MCKKEFYKYCEKNNITIISDIPNDDIIGVKIKNLGYGAISCLIYDFDDIEEKYDVVLLTLDEIESINNKINKILK